ncbi:hypothetical protein CXG53_23870, partial [Pseudomonas guariconensis]
GGRITVESVVRCSWNGWPDDRGIRKAKTTTRISGGKRTNRITSSNIARQPAKMPANMNAETKVRSTGFIPPPYR